MEYVTLLSLKSFMFVLLLLHLLKISYCLHLFDAIYYTFIFETCKVESAAVLEMQLFGMQVATATPWEMPLAVCGFQLPGAKMKP